jgi:hypothetical protein
MGITRPLVLWSCKNEAENSRKHLTCPAHSASVIIRHDNRACLVTGSDNDHISDTHCMWAAMMKMLIKHACSALLSVNPHPLYGITISSL